MARRETPARGRAPGPNANCVATWYHFPCMSRPRILIIEDERALTKVLAYNLEREGYDVAVCGGPATLPGGRCPLVEGFGCPLADHADVIIHALGTGEDASGDPGGAVLAAHGRGHPWTPTIVVRSLDQQHGRPPLSVHEVVSGPLTHERVIVAVSSILSRPRHCSP